MKMLATQLKFKGVALVSVIILLSVASFIAIDNLQIANKFFLVSNYNKGSIQFRQLTKSNLINLIKHIQNNNLPYINDLHNFLLKSLTGKHTLGYCLQKDKFIKKPCAPEKLHINSDMKLMMEIGLLKKIDDITYEIQIISSVNHDSDYFSYVADLQIIWQDTNLTKLNLLRWYKSANHVQ